MTSSQAHSPSAYSALYPLRSSTDLSYLVNAVIFYINIGRDDELFSSRTRLLCVRSRYTDQHSTFFDHHVLILFTYNMFRPSFGHQLEYILVIYTL